MLALRAFSLPPAIIGKFGIDHPEGVKNRRVFHFTGRPTESSFLSHSSACSAIVFTELYLGAQTNVFFKVVMSATIVATSPLRLGENSIRKSLPVSSRTASVN